MSTGTGQVEHRSARRYHVLPDFGPMVADEITEVEWQSWIDHLARRGLSRSTIAKHIPVMRVERI